MVKKKQITVIIVTNWLLTIIILSLIKGKIVEQGLYDKHMKCYFM